jgi:hypothetical protein
MVDKGRLNCVRETVSYDVVDESDTQLMPRLTTGMTVLLVKDVFRKFTPELGIRRTFECHLTRSSSKLIGV